MQENIIDKKNNRYQIDLPDPDRQLARQHISDANASLPRTTGFNRM